MSRGKRAPCSAIIRRMSSEDILTVQPPKADARIKYGTDENQFGDLRLPRGKGPFPVVINIHGGYWRAKYDLEHAGHLCAALTSAGFATWNVEYRRVGNLGGGWPGTMEDIKNGYRFLAQIAGEHKLDLTRAAIMGHSAGGHLALCLAAHEQSVKHAVALAGVVDLQRAWELHLSNDAVVELLGGTPSEVADHYKDADPMRLRIAASQWLIHGLKDDVVPPDFSSRYVEQKAKAGENVHLIQPADADHFDVINPTSAIWKQIEATIKKLLA